MGGRNGPEYSVGELGECHYQKLVDTAEAFDFVVAIVFLHTTAKCMLWKVKHYLSEDELTYMHDLPQKYRNNPEF